MKNSISKTIYLLILTCMANVANAQSEGGGSSMLITVLVAIAVIIFFYLVIQVADNLIAIEARQAGVDDSGSDYTVFPKMKSLFAPKLPSYTGKQPVTILKKGHDILLEGVAEEQIDKNVKITTFAIQPPNFIGISPIPKITVEVGAEVKAGDILLFDKKRPEIKHVAPVSGEIVAINRGEKRAITSVVILADKEMSYRELPSFDLAKGSREELVNYLLDSGVWPMLRQRPFDVIPDPSETPRDIFISTFDTAPLAPNLNLVVDGKGAAFQKGLDVLNKLTDGDIHLGLNARDKTAPSSVFTNAKGVSLHWFHGKHPAGNVGVQIHHIKPIGNQDKVWVLDVQSVISIGNLFLQNRYDSSRVVAVTGAELEHPKYIQTYRGANIEELVKSSKLKSDHVRFISGDVLSGAAKTEAEFLDFADDQLSVIAEGDYYEMFGWLIPSALRPTVSKTYPNFLFPDLTFKADTNTHGEKRAFVMTGQYESVLPMDVLPQHLMKAIIVNDFERMEGLGIYELSEEDIALCEFACTSKQPLQKILRQGLDLVREQG